MNKMHQPHDKLFAVALRDREVIKDLIGFSLSPALLELADLDTIRAYPSRLVTPGYIKFETDLVYEVGFRDSDNSFLFHCEFQSTHDEIMILRFYLYRMLLLQAYYHDNGLPLPIVYSTLIYTGEKSLDQADDFFELFGDQSELAKQIWFGELGNIDMLRLSDSALADQSLFGILGLVSKYRKVDDFKLFMSKFVAHLNRIDPLREVSEEFTEAVSRYIMGVYSSADAKIFSEAMGQLKNTWRKNMHTIADYYMDMGRAEMKEKLTKEYAQKEHTIADYYMDMGRAEMKEKLTKEYAQKEHTIADYYMDMGRAEMKEKLTKEYAQKEHTIADYYMDMGRAEMKEKLTKEYAQKEHTIADYYMDMGREQGIQKGKKLGIVQVAMQMLENGLPEDLIKQITGLDPAKISEGQYQE